jgi:hypothetical protein
MNVDLVMPQTHLSVCVGVCASVCECVCEWMCVWHERDVHTLL